MPTWNWKRRDPRNKFIGFLEYLDSNFYDKNQCRIEKLRKTFNRYTDDLIQQFLKQGVIEKNQEYIKITSNGLSYLDELRKNALEKEKFKYEIDKILIEILVIISLSFAILGISLREYLSWYIVFWVFVIIIVAIILKKYFDLKKFIKG